MPTTTVSASPLPVSPPAAAPTPPVLPTLLIVDDEEGPRHSLRMVFRQDFTVHAVDTADQALVLTPARIRCKSPSSISAWRGKVASMSCAG